MLPLPDDERFSQLGPQGFRFACHPKVSCFNQCCRQLNLVLTPYDVLRLKNRLGLSSGEFIDRYAEVEPLQNGWPQAKLLMRDDEERTCPFLTDKGCGVYEDRPGACRSYPLGRAAKGGASGGPSQEEFFLVREEHCQGFNEGQTWQPDTWMQDQGLEPYNQINDLFLPLITRQAPDADPAAIAKKMRMFFMACYNLDAFRDFVTKSSLSQQYVMPDEDLAKMAEDDLELLKFAFKWLAMVIYGEPFLSLRQPQASQPV